MTKKAAKKAAKKKPATKKSTGKQGKTSAKLAAKQAANDFGIPVALHDIKDALAEIKSLLQQLLRQQEQPARFVPCPPYQTSPFWAPAPSPLPWKINEVTCETKGLPPGLMRNGQHMDEKALAKAEY